MSLGKKLFHQDAAAAAAADSAQNLVLHIDANDEDSIESDGVNTGAEGDTIFDISTHDLAVPLTDNNDNLEIHIDASNTNSYSGSGSTINDVSTNTYSFSTQGNATFGSDLRGYFTLDGTGDGLQTTDAVTGFSGDLTFEWWFNASESNNFALLHANPLSNNTGINGIFIGNAAGSAGAIEIYRRRTDGTLDSNQSTSTGLSGMASDGWVHFVITITSANVCTFFKDGTKQGTVTLNGNGTNHDTYNFVNIGGYNNASYEFAGQMGCFRMYSEILSDSEIAQNFRAGNFLSYDSIYSTSLEANLDASDNTTLTASTWSDKANSNNGTFNNFSSTLSDFYDKELGNWIDFDGTNDYLQIPASTNLDIGSGGFTYETWLLNEKSSGTSSVISNTFNVSGYTGYTLRIVNGTDVTLFIYNNESIIFNQTASSSVTTNTWTHLAFTVASASSGAAVKLYINGILSSVSGTLSGAYGGSGQNIQAGQYPFAPSARYFNGKMGVLKFHSEELTAAEIAQNYLATKNDYPNGHNGTLTSVSLATGTPSYINFGAGGTTADYIDFGNSVNFPRQFSVTHWVNFSSFTVNSQHLSSYYGGGNLYYLRTDGSAGKLDWNIYGTGTTTQITSSDTQNIVLNTTEWQLVTGTCDFDGTIKIYIDKTLSASKTNNATAPNTKTASDKLYVGALNYSGSGGPFSMNADLGAFRFYDKELTSAEIDAIFDAEKATYGRS